jgi:hypothetical protein
MSQAALGLRSPMTLVDVRLQISCTAKTTRHISTVCKPKRGIGRYQRQLSGVWELSSYFLLRNV